jgi:hypothetical protein
MVLACLPPDYRNIGRHDVPIAAVLLRNFRLSVLPDARLNLFDLDGQWFLFLSELVDLPSQTHSLSVELYHDGPSDSVVNLPQVVGVDDLLDQVIAFPHGLVRPGLESAILIPRSLDFFDQVLEFTFGLFDFWFIVIDGFDHGFDFLGTIPP